MIDGSISTALASLCCVLFIAPMASADVDFYLTPEFGISGMISDVDGEAANVTGPLIFSGDDTDASPLLGLAVGLEMPLDEMLPREWLADIRLPNWPIHFEIEASGLREYDLRTNGIGPEDYFSEIKATTSFVNTWLDIPMTTLWRPFQYIFGLGRQPRLRSLIDPVSFYLGAGIGMTALEFKGTDNTFETDDDVIDFAWNVGAGFRYAVTDRVSISSGYRYVGLGTDKGSQDIDLGQRSLNGAQGSPGDSLDYDFQVHEFRLGIQIKVFSFRGAWR